MNALRALVIAVVIAAGIGVAVHRHHALTVTADFCASLDPDGWMYWLLGCKDIIAGGGGSGAS